MTAPSNSIEITDVTVVYSRWRQTVTALNRVSLSIPGGQWVMLAGPNGAGKTTLLRTLNRQVVPCRGSISLSGRALSRITGRELSGVVFPVHQDPLLGTASRLTVLENLIVADVDTSRARLSRDDRLEQYRELLEPLGLADHLRQLAWELSGGQRQLLAVLIARLRPVGILLLDEPLAALDPARAELCLREIQALNEQGKTIIQITHDERIATTVGHRTIALQEGRVAYDAAGEQRDVADLVRHWHAALGANPNAAERL